MLVDRLNLPTYLSTYKYLPNGYGGKQWQGQQRWQSFSLISNYAPLIAAGDPGRSDRRVPSVVSGPGNTPPRGNPARQEPHPWAARHQENAAPSGPIRPAVELF